MTALRSALLLLFVCYNCKAGEVGCGDPRVSIPRTRILNTYVLYFMSGFALCT